MGMVIETKRLKIIVLTQEQLEMLVDNIPEFEKRLNCSYQGEKIEGIFKNILYEQSLKIEANSDVYLWLTFWLIVKKDDNIAVGMIDFKNIPNENREVEIGYGLGKIKQIPGNFRLTSLWNREPVCKARIMRPLPSKI